MKKALIALLAIACLSALAYADGSTVSFGFGRTQFDLASGSSVANSDILQGWTPSWPNGQRMNLDYAWASDHAGFNFTTYVNNDTINVNAAYGTLKVAPDFAKVMVGLFLNDGYDAYRHDSPHPIHDQNQGNNVGRFSGWGIITEVAPKDSGFMASLGIMADDPTAGVVQRPIADAVMGNYQIAASYTVPNLVKITAGSTTMQALFPNKGRDVFAAVDLLMVPNLTLWDEFYYAGFDINPAPTIFGNELAAQYVADKLTAVVAVLYDSNTPNGSSTTVSNLKLFPEVYYNLGMITVGVYGSYLLPMVTNVSNSGSTIEVEPYIVINDFNLRISLDYVIVNPPGGGTSTSAWHIPVIFGWGF